MHLIDDDAVVAILVNGSSSALSGEVITSYTHSHIASRGLWSWFDRVASRVNPVDQLPRGEPEGPWRRVDIEFPHVLLHELEQYPVSPSL